MPFSNVIGHRRIVGLLSRSIRRDSLPPSLIFAGPAGVGKRLVAQSMAQAVNCLAPKTSVGADRDSEGDTIGDRDAVVFDACGACHACSRIARNVHPDIVIVEPGDSGSIKIDPIRDVIDRAGYRPFEGRRRVVIIDTADAMVIGAQNALLKTLEEPPSASMFVLVTSRPDVLLPTVRSRCPRLRFRALSEDDLVRALVARGRGAKEASTIAANADGSLGHALEASGDMLVEARDAAVRALTYAATADDPRRRIDGARELLVKISSDPERAQLATTLRAMASLLRDIEILTTKADRRVLANADLESTLARLTVFGGERGVRAFRAVDEALAALERNAGVKLVADWVTLSI
jgi:DNA polymerase-3 subunit delta'